MVKPNQVDKELMYLTIKTPVVLTYKSLTPQDLEAQMKKWKAKDPRWAAAFVLPADLYAQYAQQVVSLAGQAWPGRDLAEIDFSGLFVNGTALADKAKAEDKDREFYRGKFLLKASSPKEPTFGKHFGGTLFKPATADIFYNGALVVGSLTLKAMEPTKSTDKDFVKAYLNDLTFIRDGDRLGGMSAADRYGAIEGVASETNPLAQAGVTGLNF